MDEFVCSAHACIKRTVIGVFCSSETFKSKFFHKKNIFVFPWNNIASLPNFKRFGYEIGLEVFPDI
jgi:hypothetical protein